MSTSPKETLTFEVQNETEASTHSSTLLSSSNTSQTATNGMVHDLVGGYLLGASDLLMDVFLLTSTIHGIGKNHVIAPPNFSSCLVLPGLHREFAS